MLEHKLGQVCKIPQERTCNDESVGNKALETSNIAYSEFYRQLHEWHPGFYLLGGGGAGGKLTPPPKPPP